MDLSNNTFHATTSSSFLSNVFRNGSDSVIAPAKRIYFSGPFRHQNWSLPDSIIYYITKNPSSAKVYQKLVHTCKYFFANNKTVVIKNIYFDRESKKWIATSLNRVETSIKFKHGSFKIWITDFSFKPNTNLIISVIPHIYRINATTLHLVNRHISYKDLIFLASNVRHLLFQYSFVKYKDGSDVSFEEIIAALPKLKYIHFHGDISPQISSKTMKELLKIPHFSNFLIFGLSYVNEEFDIETFYNYMKTNKNTRIRLDFSDRISEGYKHRLEAIIDEILETKNHDYKPPYICFEGLADEKIKRMRSLYSSK